MKRQCFLTVQFNTLSNNKCGYHLQPSPTLVPQCCQAEWSRTVLRGKAIQPHHSKKEDASLPTITAIQLCFPMKCKAYLSASHLSHLLSPVRLFATSWTVAYQAPLSMGFSRQEYWSGLPFSSSGDLPNPGIKCWSPACTQILYCLNHQGSLI